MKVSLADNDVIFLNEEGVREGDTRTFLLMSDLHLDSPHCDRNLLKQHLEYAKQNEAYIFVFGDVFDVMQGVGDKRSRRMELLAKFAHRDDYFNAVIEDAVEFLWPYKNNILMIGKGNHEESVVRRYNIDLTSILCQSLGLGVVGGYGGYIWYYANTTGRNKNASLKIRWFHGTGGNAEATLGLSHFWRQMMYADADIIVNGHQHNNFIVDVTKEVLTKGGKISYNKVTLIRTPSYKNHRKGGIGQGWENERGFSPKVIGCVRLNVVVTRPMLWEATLMTHVPG